MITINELSVNFNTFSESFGLPVVSLPNNIRQILITFNQQQIKFAKFDLQLSVQLLDKEIFVEAHTNRILHRSSKAMAVQCTKAFLKGSIKFLMDLL